MEANELDRLTGAKTRHALEATINAEILRTEPTLFVARYLCVDIDNFRAYLDFEGLTAGDETLSALGRALLEHYGRESVYRVDADDFVIDLRDREPWIPTVGGIMIKHATLDVALSRNRARNHHVRKWIMMNIDAASLGARSEGVSLSCGEPPSLSRM